MIPKKLHWIWVGSKPMPAQYVKFIERAKAMHPGWECRVWRDEDFRGFEAERRIREARSMAGRADIARYEILLREGGIYLDCDIELLRPLDALLGIADMVVCNEDAHIDKYCSIGFIAASAGHPVLRQMVNALLSTDPNSGPPNHVTGPYFFGRHLGCNHAVLPTQAFYPYLYNESSVVLEHRDLSGSFGIHHWGGSWLDGSLRVDKAIKEIQSGAYSVAFDTLRGVLRDEPDNQSALEVVGTLVFKAVCQMAEFLKLQPDPTSGFMVDLGAAYRKAGSFELLFERVEKVRDSVGQAAVNASAGGGTAIATDSQNTEGVRLSDSVAVRRNLKERLVTRSGTDDDKWVVPELVDLDMYRFEELAKLAPNGEVSVIDCGAHIGVFSSLCAEFFPHAIVHAFEPQPDNYSLLVSNTGLYQGRVKAMQAAVGVESGRLSLHKQGGVSDGFTGRWSMVPEDGGGQDSVEVDVIELRDYIRQLDKPVFLMKMDLEGFEAMILSHLTQQDLSQIGILVIEEHHVPIDHGHIRAAGHKLVFNPLGSDRHYVYINMETLVRLASEGYGISAV